MKLFDLTLPIGPDMVTWPGAASVRVDPLERIARGGAANVSELRFGSHTGTHIDPPYHFVEGGATVDQLPLESLMGRAWVCDMRGKVQIDVAELRDAIPADTARLLLKTDNSALWHSGAHDFVEDFVVLTPAAARWIAARGDVRLLGMDYLSVEPPDSPGNPVHHALLEAGVAIVEGLDLSALEGGWYNLWCLPLKVAGGDGAPVRAVASGPLE